jgi:hypothetical protein
LRRSPRSAPGTWRRCWMTPSFPRSRHA